MILSDIHRECAALARAARNRMAEQRPAPLVHLLPHRHGEERRPGRPGSGQLAAIIFKHYRELTTEEVADEWFSILPKPDQMRTARHGTGRPA